MINNQTRIFIAGHKGMLGSSILRILRKKGYKNLITVEKKKLDLRNQLLVKKFFNKKRPQAVIIAAAKVGGIKANMDYPADFIQDNLQIQTNLISTSYNSKVKKLILFGSSCIYPKNLKKPIRENQMMTGPLEETNDSYSVAKIAGIKMIEAFNKQYKKSFICLMPCNLFGPNDNYDTNNSHFLPALIKKIYLASKRKKNKVVKLWGTGKPKREFVYVDDLAEAILVVAEKYDKIDPINIGSGEEVTIKQLALLIRRIINYNGRIVFNSDFPDGVPRKFLDSSRIHRLGWKPKTKLMDGISFVYKWFLENE